MALHERFDAGDLTGVPSLARLLQRRSWAEQAACSGSEAQWIPDVVSGGRELPTAVVPLLEICAGCPVRVECLTDAFDTDGGVELFGVWGGTTQLERRAARTAIGSSHSKAWRYRDHGAVDGIVAGFEATFPDRLAGWRERLAEHERWLVSRFTLGGRPGPGRGHLALAARNARKLGISTRTVQRRMKAKRERV